MTALSVRLPESLHQQLKHLAQQEGVSINQLIVLSIAEKMTALSTEEFFRERAAQADRAAFLAVLDRAPMTDPQSGDEVPTHPTVKP